MSRGLFERRVRGFRIVEVGALVVLLALILAVYLAKTGAGGKRADIDHIQDQIVEEQGQIRVLRAEVASLERPERLEALATRYLGLQPIPARHEITPEALEDVAAGRATIVAGSDPVLAAGSPDLSSAPQSDQPDASAAAASAPPAATSVVAMASPR